MFDDAGGFLLVLMMTLGCDICFFSVGGSILLNALARRSDGWDLLGGQDAKRLRQQMRMRPYHRLPARCLHHICGMSKKNKDSIN